MSTLVELSDDEFQTTIDGAAVPVLVDFSATWCQPCKALAPVIEAVAGEFEGKLIVRKVDIDKAQQTAIRFGIQGVPTCIFFKGGTEVDRFHGMKDLNEVRGFVEKVIG
ncbi:MAG: thioredoxin [Planctomycetota bacterium]